MDDNLVLRTINMCENEFTISFGKILVVVGKWYTWEGEFYARTLPH